MPNLLLSEDFIREEARRIYREKLRTTRKFKCEPGMLLSVITGHCALDNSEAVHVSGALDIWSQAKVTKVNKPGLMLYA